MATTYLQLTNELLRESNEVVLTSSNFSSALGVQAHVKDCVNRAYNDIVSAEPRWSFLATGESGATDPFYGNVYVETTAGTRWYELKAASSSVTTDYGAIDWNDFYLTTIGVSGESAPYTSQNLSFVTFARSMDSMTGIIFIFFIIVVAAAEAVVGLSIILSIFRKRKSLNIDEFNLLKW